VKTRYIVLIGVGAALAVVASLLTGPIVRDVRYGTQIELEATQDVEENIGVKVGDKVSFVVRDNSSVGDNWWLKKKPEYATAELLYDEFVSPSSAESLLGVGRRYYTFLAKTVGAGQIVLINMFQQGTQAYTVTINLTINGQTTTKPS
jgi:hypothetical protein